MDLIRALLLGGFFMSIMSANVNFANATQQAAKEEKLKENLMPATPNFQTQFFEKLADILRKAEYRHS